MRSESETYSRVIVTLPQYCAEHEASALETEIKAPARDAVATAVHFLNMQYRPPGYWPGYSIQRKGKPLRNAGATELEMILTKKQKRALKDLRRFHTLHPLRYYLANI